MQSLAGRHIVVTRPIGQTAHLAELLIARNALPVFFPVLEIRDIEDIEPVLDAAIRLDSFDFAVFVSPNAIDKALAIILPRRAWPATLPVVALGKASEEALARHGIAQVISPLLRFDSEALLELPELRQVSGKRIVVFRGDGGRDLLGDTLRARGATVEFVTCYRRLRPATDATPLLRLWEANQLDAVTLTSSEGLRNFCEMVGPLGRAWLQRTPVVVSHQRIAEQAHTLGLQKVIPTTPGDQGLIDALVQYYAHDGTITDTGSRDRHPSQ